VVFLVFDPVLITCSFVSPPEIESCHLALVLIFGQTKQIRINIHDQNNTKKTVQTIQNTVNTSTHITRTPTPYRTHTYMYLHITKQGKTTTVQDTPKWNSYSIIKYPQYKVTLMYKVVQIWPGLITHKSVPVIFEQPCTWYFYPQELHRNSLRFKTK
jgi:hypothetical protein